LSLRDALDGASGNCYTLVVPLVEFFWISGMKLKKIGILFHPKVKATIAKAREVEQFLQKNSVDTWICSAWEPDDIAACIDGTELIVTVGGDGTILRAFHAIGDAAVPVTGINLGKLGFLAEIDAGDAVSQLEKLLNGSGWIDERSMLAIELSSGNEAPRRFFALNDVSVGRGEVIRLVKIDVVINDMPFTTYRADAVVVATSTGSTGYALAARGPVLYPQSRDVVMLPVAPHLSMPYPLVLPETAAVKLTVNTYHAASMSVDGHDNLSLSDGDVVTVTSSNRTARFLRFRPREAFFSSLEEKLRGKQREPGRKS